MKTVWVIVQKVEGEEAIVQLNEEWDMESLLLVPVAAFAGSGSTPTPGDLVAVTVEENDDISSATVSCGFCRGSCEDPEFQKLVAELSKHDPVQPTHPKGYKAFGKAFTRLTQEELKSMIDRK
jgi:hypothetical protein